MITQERLRRKLERKSAGNWRRGQNNFSNSYQQQGHEEIFI